MRLSFKDAAFYSLMVGMGESYLPAFVLALGFSAASAGLISTVPVIIGSMIQLSFLWIYSEIHSLKNWVVWCARFQAFVLFTIAALPSVFPNLLSPIYIAASLYWAATFSAGPAWNAWLGSLIPVKVRVHFFAQRSRQAEIFTYSGLFLAGVLLFWSRKFHLDIEAFTALLVIAAICRLISAWYLSRQQDSPKQKVENVISSKFDYSKLWSDPKLKYILGYMFILQCSVFLAAPYFTPYMLQNLNLDYMSFMFLSGATFLSRIIFYPKIQKIAQRYGPVRMLWIATFIISLTPLFWTFSQNYFYLIVLQIISGAAWGMQELGFFLLLLNRFQVQVRSKILSFVNFLSASGMLIGSLLGAQILLGENPPDAFFFKLFTYSFFGRLLTLFILPKIDEVPAQYRFAIFWRTIGLRPNMGAMMRPLLYAQKKNKKDDAGHKKQ